MFVTTSWPCFGRQKTFWRIVRNHSSVRYKHFKHHWIRSRKHLQETMICLHKKYRGFVLKLSLVLHGSTCYSNKLQSPWWRWREIKRQSKSFAEQLAANYARKVSCHVKEADFKRKMEETIVTIAHIYIYIHIIKNRKTGSSTETNP